MEERLVVKNFGPIKDIDIRIGKLTVLIGEQATGKSTLGKLLAVCKDFEVLNPVAGKEIGEEIRNQGMETFTNSETQFQYYCNDYNITTSIDWQDSVEYIGESSMLDRSEYPVLKVEVKPTSEDLIKTFSNVENILSSTDANDLFTIHGFLQKYIDDHWVSAFYMYAERNLQSIFSLGKRTINQMPDSLYDYLAVTDRIARNFPTGLNIPPLSIEYKNQNGVGYFRKKGEEQYHKMQNAASGYQSTIPIVLLIEYYTQIRKKKKTFIIEEPELNLFPTTQHRLMQYLVSNLNKTENQILITTHSPYILAALNNMLNAYKSGQIDKERTEAILPADYWLNADEVTAYRLMPDGTAKDLMNRELSMIHSEEVDEVSGEINQQFDDLVTIQLEAENE